MRGGFDNPRPHVLCTTFGWRCKVCGSVALLVMYEVEDFTWRSIPVHWMETHRNCKGKAK